MAPSNGGGTRLFEPTAIGSVALKNRIVMAPMAVDGMATLHGGFNQRAVEYHVARARGGVGLIITGMVKIESDLEEWRWNSWPNAGVSPEHFIQTSAELTERVHAFGTKIFLQMTLGEGRVASPEYHAKPPVAPSPVPNFWEPDVTCRELSTAEVEGLVRRMAAAARVAQTAGFDGVEVHALHEGFLLDQFATALTNQREDRYGGDLDGRLTLAREVVASIKAACGKDFPVTLRFSVKSFIKAWNKGAVPGEAYEEAGRDTEEGLLAAQILEAAGYDAFDADAGSHEAWYWPHPPVYMDYGCHLPLTERLKQVVSVPVIVAGRMDDPGLAERALAMGQADLIGVGRALLADPDWPRLTRRGCASDIRPCIACHQCIERTALMRPMSCAVNPTCGREAEYGLAPTPRPRRVLIVGGGIAGMEAARVAALRGHKVTLLEKGARLGGLVIAGSVPAFKRPHGRLLAWYERQLDELKVDLRLEVAATSETVLSADPDAVIVATGGTPVRLSPAMEGARPLLAEELLLAANPDGSPMRGPLDIVVIGGGLVGCETALWLSQHGRRVTVVERLDGLMSSPSTNCPLPNRLMLIDMLRERGVKTVLGHVAAPAEKGQVALKRNTSPEADDCVLAADLVVLATGYSAEHRLADELQNSGVEAFVVGDAARPGNIMSAIWDAYEVARAL